MERLFASLAQRWRPVFDELKHALFVDTLIGQVLSLLRALRSVPEISFLTVFRSLHRPEPNDSLVARLDNRANLLAILRVIEFLLVHHLGLVGVLLLDSHLEIVCDPLVDRYRPSFTQSEALLRTGRRTHLSRVQSWQLGLAVQSSNH